MKSSKNNDAFGHGSKHRPTEGMAGNIRAKILLAIHRKVY